MEREYYDFTTPGESTGCEECFETDSVFDYTAKAFAWVSLGLMISALTALLLRLTGITRATAVFPFPVLLLLLQCGIAVLFCNCMYRFSVAMARGVFIAFSVLCGVTFSYLLLFDMGLISIFAASSVYFGLTAALGYFLKVDLTRVRYWVVGGLLFAFLFWLLSLLLKLSTMVLWLSFGAIFFFFIIAACDIQKIRNYHIELSASPDSAAKASIYPALQLYLDFICMFVIGAYTILRHLNQDHRHVMSRGMWH